MRILLVPNLGLRNLQGDSSWNITVDVCRRSVGKLFAYVPVTDDYADSIPDDLPPNMKVVTTPFRTPGFWEYETCFDRWMVEMFSHGYGRYPVEATVTTSGAPVPVLQRVLSNRERKCPMVSFILDLNWSVAKGWLWGSYAHEEAFHALRALGHALGYTFMSNDEQVRRLSRLCRRWVSATMCRRIAEQSVLGGCFGLDCETVRMATAGVRKNEQFTIVWAARMNPGAGGDVAARLLADIYAAGHETPVILRSPTAPSDALDFLHTRTQIIPLTSWDTQFGVGRDEYLRTIARGHVFLCTYRLEGIGMAPLEQLYAGLIGVLPKKPHIVSVLGEDYPYFYRSKQEAWAMLLHLEQHWNAPENHALIEKMRRKIEAERDWPEVLAFRNAKMAEVIQANYRKSAESFVRHGTANRKLVDDALILLRNQRVVAWRDVCRAMDSLERGYFNEHRAARLTPFDVYEGLKTMGYRDTLDTADPLFEKVEAV